MLGSVRGVPGNRHSYRDLSCYVIKRSMGYHMKGFIPTAESHGFKTDLLWSVCRTTKSPRSRSESAELSGTTDLHVGLHRRYG